MNRHPACKVHPQRPAECEPLRQLPKQLAQPFGERRMGMEYRLAKHHMLSGEPASEHVPKSGQTHHPPIADDCTGNKPFLGMFGEIPFARLPQPMGFLGEMGLDQSRCKPENIGFPRVPGPLDITSSDRSTTVQQRRFEISDTHSDISGDMRPTCRKNLTTFTSSRGATNLPPRRGGNRSRPEAGLCRAG